MLSLLLIKRVKGVGEVKTKLQFTLVNKSRKLDQIDLMNGADEKNSVPNEKMKIKKESKTHGKPHSDGENTI